MSTRYAAILTNDEGQEVVSDIKQMEGAPPEIRSGENTEFVKVPDGVLIGMIKGGPVDAVAGYGFAEGTAGKTGRSEAGVTKVDEPAKVKAAEDAAKAKTAKE